ncbi:uncharacterized protein WM294_001203 [Sarcoramphus papa]
MYLLKLSTLETSHLRLKGHSQTGDSSSNLDTDNGGLATTSATSLTTLGWIPSRPTDLGGLSPHKRLQTNPSSATGEPTHDVHWAYVFPPLAGCAALPAPAAASGGRRASGAGCPRLPASRERRPGSAGTPRLSPAPLVRPAGRRPVLAHAQTARGCRGAGSHLRRPAGTSQAWPSSRRRRLPSAELQMRQVTKMHDHFHDLPGLNHKTACGTPLSVGLPATSRKGRSRPSSATLDLLKKS